MSDVLPIIAAIALAASVGMGTLAFVLRLTGLAGESLIKTLVRVSSYLALIIGFSVGGILLPEAILRALHLYTPGALYGARVEYLAVCAAAIMWFTRKRL
jgi:hypothetical protein